MSQREDSHKPGCPWNYNPATQTERELVETMATARWRMLRVLCVLCVLCVQNNDIDLEINSPAIHQIF